MSEFVCFGDPSRFEIALRWVEDCEPRDLRPLHGGWSSGDIRLTVRNTVLTRHEFIDGGRDAIRWYLLPFFEWLATNWVALLHEERFAWQDNRPAPAATSVFMALRRLIDAHAEPEKEAYAAVQGWWARHAMRAADSSALFPDLVIRRFVDDIEISWTARQPSYAPDGYRFVLAPGAAVLPVADVAAPLWEALAWSVSVPPRGLDANDLESIVALERKIDRLKSLPISTLEMAYLPDKLFDKLQNARAAIGVPDSSYRVAAVPAIQQFDDAVLMFGGVNPDIGMRDTDTLLNHLAKQIGGQDSPELASLVDTTVGAPLMSPFEEGYDLAEELLDRLGLDGGTTFVDVRQLVRRLCIGVVETPFETSTIRGVAIAGERYGPAIIVNLTSSYNAQEPGRRFTLAHELFHILFDRKRARRIAHSSGPWASPGIEKRANAFAAMLLMPRSLVRRLLPGREPNLESLFAAATAMQVGARALLEHIFNIGDIDEIARDELRASLEKPI